MARPMAFRRIPVALVSIIMLLSACSERADRVGPVITRALLPPAEAAAADPGTTTTTIPSLSSTDADQLARTEVRSVLAAAGEVYANLGTYDADFETVSQLASGVKVVSLQEAAAHNAVVYDAFDQRLTLYRQSDSGRWFCIDVTEAGEDYGLGDTFEQALEECTDGVRADGWGDLSSPIGSDEAAITAVFRALGDALVAGDVVAAHAIFDPRTACSLPDLQARWPDGLALEVEGGFDFDRITIRGQEATAAVSFSSTSEAAWPLVKRDAGWLSSPDPCLILGDLAADLVETAARDLLELGLFAVRSTYVMQTSFTFSPQALADLEADLIMVATDELVFGTLAYRGGEREGLLVTAAGLDRFYCAVESSFATTVYGEGSVIEDVDSVARCQAHATP